MLRADPRADRGPTAVASATHSPGRAPGRAPGPPSGRVPSRAEALAASRWPRLGGVLLVLVGLAALIGAMVPVGPSWLGQAGSVAVATAYSWALAARTSGRPVVFGALALVAGVGVQFSHLDWLHTGAAVAMSVVAAVLAVMITVPAATFLRAARECVLAYVVAGIGALAVVGFGPVVTVLRFEYLTFALALVAAFALVYRLGAGLHGLGRRGVAVVVVGGVLVVITLAYAELLRRYGTPALVETLLDDVRWSRRHLGAFPRPIETVLGVPALVYGCHLRARRRQGWWVCAFGVAGTSAAAAGLINPEISLRESGLAVLYALIVGLLIGYVVIRLDRLLTGAGAPSRGKRVRGRRAARPDDPAETLRPEPSRSAGLL